MERIVPANLDGDELWRRNGEYVDAESYDAAVARMAELEKRRDRIFEIVSQWLTGNLDGDAAMDAVMSLNADDADTAKV